jgi:hypothetical protein
MKVTSFGSCRQYSLGNNFQLTSIQEELTYPHYSKEIIQAIEYCKNIHTYSNDLTKFCFRTGILNKSPITKQQHIMKEFEETDIFVVEIASRIQYQWNGLYVHHILSEPQYGFSDIPSIKISDLTDEEIEADILKIRDLLAPKPFIAVSYIYTRTTGKRYELVQLLKNICTKHNIPFIDPSASLSAYSPSIIYRPEPVLAHYTEEGNKLIANIYKDYINSVMKEYNKKTVIHVWTQNVMNMNKGNFWGFGDILRGTISLYKLSKKYDFELIIDFSLHPISQCLEAKKHKYSKLVQDNKSNIKFIVPENLEKHINNEFKLNNVIMFHTNGFIQDYNEPLTDDCKNFVKECLKLSPECNEYIEKYFGTISKPYTIQHFRNGDRSVHYGITSSNYSKQIDIYKKYYESTDIIFSDDKAFKKFLFSSLNAKILDTTPIHMGTSTNIDGIRDTLLEFIIASRAQKIKTWSTYCWVSGFMKTVSRVFDVELVEMS